MALASYNAKSSGQWSDKSNWLAGSLPVADDDVQIDGGGSGIIVTFDIAVGPGLDSLTVGNGGTGAITLALGGKTLNVNGIGGGATDMVTLDEQSACSVTLAGGTINAGCSTFTRATEL